MGTLFSMEQTGRGRSTIRLMRLAAPILLVSLMEFQFTLALLLLSPLLSQFMQQVDNPEVLRS
jgi:hypothetical protein